MELIKKIKQTENQAQEIIEKARAEAAQRIENDKAEGQSFWRKPSSKEKKLSKLP
jgi:vacuolar-type H+-ATPase subunit H